MVGTAQGRLCPPYSVSSNRHSRPHPRRDILLDPGLLFRRHCPLEPIALLQTGPISPDVGPEILGQIDIFGQPQRVADHDIGCGEAAGAQCLGVAGRSLDRAQPSQKPFGVISRHLRVAAFFRLELAVADSVASEKYIQFRKAP